MNKSFPIINVNKSSLGGVMQLYMTCKMYIYALQNITK